jgi:hypothetical protein
MEPFAGSPSTIGNHSESFHRQLNAYALAAGAAGVSLLALAQPCEARIIHRQIGVKLFGINHYEFNPANQSAAPFLFSGSFINQTYGWWNRVWMVPRAASAGVLLAKNGFDADLRLSVVVGGDRVFGEGVSSGLLFTYGPYGGGTLKHHRGNFSFNQTAYVGFKFSIAGKEHFGWLRLKITIHPFPGEKQTTVHIRDYAYETVPGKSIRTGQTEEAADSDEISGNPRSASLGALALGASGIPLWRRQEKLSAAE